MMAASCCIVLSVEKARNREFVGLAHEWMKILVESGFGRPVPERNADFVGGIASCHPVTFLYTDNIQKVFEWWRRALAYADDANIRRFHQRDIEASVLPVLRYQIGGNPSGGAATEDHDTFHAVFHNSSLLHSVAKKNRPTSVGSSGGYFVGPQGVWRAEYRVLLSTCS